MISKRAKEEQFGVEKFLFSFRLKTLNSGGTKKGLLWFSSPSSHKIWSKIRSCVPSAVLR